MFRAVIKNAGLEDQSTIFILEICFSYQEIQVSRPNVNSVTRSFIFLSYGLPLHPDVKRSGARSAEQRGGRRGARPRGCGRRVWGQGPSGADKHTPVKSCTPQPRCGPQTKGAGPYRRGCGVRSGAGARPGGSGSASGPGPGRSSPAGANTGPGAGGITAGWMQEELQPRG